MAPDDFVASDWSVTTKEWPPTDTAGEHRSNRATKKPGYSLQSSTRHHPCPTAERPAARPPSPGKGRKPPMPVTAIGGFQRSATREVPPIHCSWFDSVVHRSAGLGSLAGRPGLL